MKKFIVILLTLVLFSSLLTVTALADGAAALYVNSVTAKAGDTVTLTVGISNNPGISGIQVSINPDSRLEDPSYSGTGMLGKGMWTIGNSAVWSNSGDVVYNGQILSLTFKVPANAKPGDVFQVNVSASAGNWNRERVPVGGASGTITIVCDHEWELTSTKPHTCTEDGEELYTCSICGETKTSVIPAAHTFDETVWDHDDFAHWHNCKFCDDAICCEKDHIMVPIDNKQATSDDWGYEIKECSVCGYQERTNYPPTGPDMPDEPQVGDIRPLMLAGFTAVLFTLAAVAYVFKRKFVK